MQIADHTRYIQHTLCLWSLHFDFSFARRLLLKSLIIFHFISLKLIPPLNYLKYSIKGVASFKI